MDSAFKLSECKQESECKFPMSSGAGAGVTFSGTGAGVKKVTPITSVLRMDAFNSLKGKEWLHGVVAYHCLLYY